MESFAFANPPDRSTHCRMISFAHLWTAADPEALQAELQKLLVLHWVDHVNRQDYNGAWDVLPLRCQSQHLEAHPVLQGFAIAAGEDWQDLPVLATCPAIGALLKQLKCPLKAVRLMRLHGGAQIKPHRDPGLGIEYGEARLHLPMQTSDQVIFTVHQQVVPMRTGELWYINADQEHAVHNRGSEDRINLVIDCVANAWLVEKVIQAHRQQEPVS